MMKVVLLQVQVLLSAPITAESESRKIKFPIVIRHRREKATIYNANPFDPNSIPYFKDRAFFQNVGDHGGVVKRRSPMKSWWACSDSNREPKHYECSALTVELQARRNSLPETPATFKNRDEKLKNGRPRSHSLRWHFCPARSAT